MATFVSATHISKYSIRVDFSEGMLNDSELAGLSATVHYIVHGGAISVTYVATPLVHSQPFAGVGLPSDGGSPSSVYLVLNADPSDYAASVNVEVKYIVGAGPKDFNTQNQLTGGLVKACTTYESYDHDYWESTGLRLKQTETELSKIGKTRFTSAQPFNFGILHLIGKLFDMADGGVLSTLGTAIDGPLEPSAATGYAFSGSGFSLGPASYPGIGETITLTGIGIPPHVEKLWGVSDGSNTLFRTSIPYHSFACELLYIYRTDTGYESRLMLASEWTAPNSGTDRVIRLGSAIDRGESIIAIYKPRKSLLRIGHEIIAYDNSDITADTVEIVGRAQLRTPLEAHSIGEHVVDFWNASMVTKAEYNQFVFGASGRALEHLATDKATPKSDNPTLSDTELRRMVFNTSVTQRGVPEIVRDAIRYIYPDLSKYIFVCEDIRWKNCVVFWYSSTPVTATGEVNPPVEPWEDWLDDLSYPPGFDLTLYYDTYLRNPITDVSYDGDYFTPTSYYDDELFLHPVVVSGPDIYLIGTPSPYLPDPYWTSSDYTQYIVRPESLSRVLPVGVGVLLLDLGFIL